MKKVKAKPALGETQKWKPKFKRNPKYLAWKFNFQLIRFVFSLNYENQKKCTVENNFYDS